MIIWTRFKSECECLEPGGEETCRIKTACLKPGGWSIGARRHTRQWTLHDVNDTERAVIQAHPCLEASETDPTAKKQQKPAKKAANNG